MARQPRSALEHALRHFGPLEARIMRAAWRTTMLEPFVVHDVQALMPELAYTTVMSTMMRLAEKGLLRSRHVAGTRAHQYWVRQTPEEYLSDRGRQDVEKLARRLGEAAIPAFEAKLGELTPEQRKRLRRLGGR